MKNTNIKQIAFTVLIGLFLNACGGGGGGSGFNPIIDDGTNPPVSEVKVPQCGTATDKGKSLAEDVTGKTIQKVDDGAEVRIWHSPDATKLACMISGEAIISPN